MFKQPLTPWINRTFKDQQKCWIWENPKIMLHGLNVTSYLVSTQTVAIALKVLFSSQCLLLDFPSEDF